MVFTWYVLTCQCVHMSHITCSRVICSHIYVSHVHMFRPHGIFLSRVHMFMYLHVHMITRHGIWLPCTHRFTYHDIYISCVHVLLCVACSHILVFTCHMSTCSSYRTWCKPNDLVQSNCAPVCPFTRAYVDYFTHLPYVKFPMANRRL